VKYFWFAVQIGCILPDLMYASSSFKAVFLMQTSWQTTKTLDSRKKKSIMQSIADRATIFSRCHGDLDQ